MGQDAALAIEDVARVALTALHAVVVAVALEADGGTARLAHTDAALVVAVGRAGDGWNTRHTSGLARSRGPCTVSFRPRLPPLREAWRGLSRVTFALRLPLLLESLHPTHSCLNDGPQSGPSHNLCPLLSRVFLRCALTCDLHPTSRHASRLQSGTPHGRL